KAIPMFYFGTLVCPLHYSFPTNYGAPLSPFQRLIQIPVLLCLSLWLGACTPPVHLDGVTVSEHSSNSIKGLQIQSPKSMDLTTANVKVSGACYGNDSLQVLENGQS